MTTLDMTAQAIPVYWAMIAIMVAAAVSFAAEVLPREVASFRNRMVNRRRARLFVLPNAAKASA